MTEQTPLHWAAHPERAVGPAAPEAHVWQRSAAYAPSGANVLRTFPARTNHVLHLVLCFFTFGFWLPVYVAIAVYNNNRLVQQWVWDPYATVPRYTTGVSDGQILPAPHHPQG